jgi:chemotaxis protein MotA
MDLTTIIGFVFCVAVVIFGILNGGEIGGFIDTPSFFIVVLGSLGAMGVAFPGPQLKGSFKVLVKALTFTPRDPKALLTTLQEMSNRARREGTLSLEEFISTMDDEFFARGIQLVVDGHEPQAVEDILYLEIEKIQERHKAGISFFEGFGELAPAFGMIGTLIGLVNMLAKLDDPSAIGPAMAVALLTTLYGSLIANTFAIPIAKKLKCRSDEEVQEKELIAQGILSILNRESPRFLVERLNVQLSPTERIIDAS